MENYLQKQEIGRKIHQFIDKFTKPNCLYKLHFTKNGQLKTKEYSYCPIAVADAISLSEKTQVDLFISGDLKAVFSGGQIIWENSI